MEGGNMHPESEVAKARKRLHASIVADLQSGMTWLETAVKNHVSLTTVLNHARKEKARAALEAGRQVGEQEGK
jgi:hypothetical protein